MHLLYSGEHDTVSRTELDILDSCLGNEHQSQLSEK